jgi:hypothetical protein
VQDKLTKKQPKCILKRRGYFDLKKKNQIEQDWGIEQQQSTK